MTEIMAVTSFGAKGFEDYGREGLTSFVRHWPGNIAVYYENAIPDFPHSDKIIWRKLYQDMALVRVLEWARRSPAMQGVMPDGGYNYNNDLYKFCRKVFAVTHAAQDFKGLLFWLDADVKMHANVPATLLERLMKDVYTCYMGRKQYHSECSFVGYDTKHEQSQNFMEHFRWIYTSGAVLSLHGFHDCWAYDYCRGKTGVPARNLTPKGKLIEDVMPMTELAKYMVHLKGRDKYEAA